MPSDAMTPLAPLAGASPAAPQWFVEAIAVQPTRRLVRVNGCDIETLTWGRPDAPPLLLLHGKLAHADWWSFIAPTLARTHRVVAPSWSGMGGSGWRESYSVDTMATEIDGVCTDLGLFGHARKPVLVAHSFGAFAALRQAAIAGEKLGGVVALDIPLLSREQRLAQSTIEERDPSTRPRSNRVYASVEEALARFRLAPPQTCDNLFIADFIARLSLRRVPATADTDAGWTWKFDPAIWHGLRPDRRTQGFRDARCPVAVMWGANSALTDRATLARVAELLPAGSPFVEIPAAQHHVMIDQPLALTAALTDLLLQWPIA